MKAPEKQEHAEESSHPLVSFLTFVTYPVAALAAYFVGRTEVRKSIYKNFVTSGAFKDLQSEHRAEIADIMKVGEGLVADGPKLTQETNHAYRMAVKERFEKAGFKNIADYWHGLHPNQKVNAAMFAAGTAGLVITTSLAVIENKKLLEKLNIMEKEKQDPHEIGTA